MACPVKARISAGTVQGLGMDLLIPLQVFYPAASSLLPTPLRLLTSHVPWCELGFVRVLDVFAAAASDSLIAEFLCRGLGSCWPGHCDDFRVTGSSEREIF